MDPKLLENLCRCLAFHTVETENVNQMADGQCTDMVEQIETAKRLIKEAGFDFDTLYPVSERPTVGVIPSWSEPTPSLLPTENSKTA